MKKNLFIIITGIILFGIGIILTVYELNTYDLNNKVPIKEKNELTYSADNKYKYRVLCNNCNIKYEVNNKITNTFNIKVEYPSDYYDYKIEEELIGKTKYISILSDNVKINDIFNLIVRDLKNKQTRNYFYYFKTKVTITTSSDNLERLGIKNAK